MKRFFSIVPAVQRVLRVRADLIIISTVRMGESPLGIALRCVLVAAGLALAGGDEAAGVSPRHIQFITDYTLSATANQCNGQ